MRILEDPIVAVRDAPIILKPVEYDKEPISGSNENKSKIMIGFINGCRKKRTSFDANAIWLDSYDNNPIIIKPTRINPEVNIEAAATSIDECFKTSLLRKRTPIAKPNAERIASISPKLIIDNNDVVFIAVSYTHLTLPTICSV